MRLFFLHFGDTRIKLSRKRLDSLSWVQASMTLFAGLPVKEKRANAGGIPVLAMIYGLLATKTGDQKIARLIWKNEELSIPDLPLLQRLGSRRVARLCGKA